MDKTVPKFKVGDRVATTYGKGRIIQLIVKPRSFSNPNPFSYRVEFLKGSSDPEVVNRTIEFKEDELSTPDDLLAALEDLKRVTTSAPYGEALKASADQLGLKNQKPSEKIKVFFHDLNTVSFVNSNGLAEDVLSVLSSLQRGDYEVSIEHEVLDKFHQSLDKVFPEQLVSVVRKVSVVPTKDSGIFVCDGGCCNG
jgi:hypothetical protein